MSRLISIPKRSGGFRTVYKQSNKQKRELRSLLYSKLNNLALQLCDKEVVHGFLPTKSIVTNAKQHIKYNYTTRLDISNFFDSITPEHVKEYLTAEDIDKCFIDGRAYQGLSTSPIIGIFATIKLVKEIKEYLATINDNIRFTLYADDISISHDNYNTYLNIIKEIPIIVAKYKFIINKKKNRVMDNRYGRRQITGLMVDNEKVSISRLFKRNLRAALFQKSESARGMQEFAKLKLPNPCTPQQQLENLLSTVIFYNNKAILKDYKHPDIERRFKPTIDRINNVKLNPTRRNKNLIKETVKNELRHKVIKKEDLIRVSKLKSKL